MARITPNVAPRSSGRATVSYRALDGTVHDAVVEGGGRNEVQTVTVASATGGTFTLTFNGQTTGAIAHNATAAAVQTALRALSNIGSNGVVCTGGPLGTAAVSVEFTGPLGATDVAQMTATSSLTGTGAAVTIATATTSLSKANLNLFVPTLPLAARRKTTVARRTTLKGTNVWF